MRFGYHIHSFPAERGHSYWISVWNWSFGVGNIHKYEDVKMVFVGQWWYEVWKVSRKACFAFPYRGWNNSKIYSRKICLFLQPEPKLQVALTTRMILIQTRILIIDLMTMWGEDKALICWCMSHRGIKTFPQLPRMYTLQLVLIIMQVPQCQL